MGGFAEFDSEEEGTLLRETMCPQGDTLGRATARRGRIVPIRGGLGIAVPPASAHYYAYAYLFGSSFLGAQAQDRVNNIGINPATDFLNNEMWVADTGQGSWVETGIDKGTGTAGCNDTSSPVFFWAESFSNGTYVCRKSSDAASLNTYYPVSIQLFISGYWTTQAGDFYGSTGSVQPSANLIEGGIEMTSQSIYTCASLSSLAYTDAGGGITTGWRDASNGNAQIYNALGNPPTAYWVSQPNWERGYANESC